MTNIVELNPVMTKARKHAPASETEFYARIVNPGKKDATIEVHRVAGYESGKGRSFCVGDICEIDSYNLVYTGVIEKITEKSVVVRQYETDTKTKRMDIYMFAWRNYNFNEAETSRQNAETMMYI